MPEFIKVLSKIRNLIILNTYSAGEKKIVGATSKDIYLKVFKINKNSVFLNNINKLENVLHKFTLKNNTIIFII